MASDIFAKIGNLKGESLDDHDGNLVRLTIIAALTSFGGDSSVTDVVDSREKTLNY